MKKLFTVLVDLKKTTWAHSGHLGTNMATIREIMEVSPET